MSTYKPDAGIPVLTEVIPTLTDVIPTPAEESFAPPAGVSGQKAEPQQVPGASVSPVMALAEELQHLEHEICERVLQQVLTRIDFVLEQRVRDSFADVLQTSVERVATELRSGLQQSLAEVITRAVSQEISRLQNGKK